MLVRILVVVGVLVVALAVVVIAVAVRRRRTSVYVGRTARAKLTCPSCGHRFERPDITVVTKDIVRKYGPNPVQCKRCGHIWSTGDEAPMLRSDETGMRMEEP